MIDHRILDEDDPIELLDILDDRSEPEPDVCVVHGSPRDYVDSHPTRPALIVEVAQSGLRLARGRKAAAYARARTADYWIVNLVDRVLEVHREPMRPVPSQRHWLPTRPSRRLLHRPRRSSSPISCRSPASSAAR